MKLEGISEKFDLGTQRNRYRTPKRNFKEKSNVGIGLTSDWLRSLDNIEAMNYTGCYAFRSYTTVKPSHGSEGRSTADSDTFTVSASGLLPKKVVFVEPTEYPDTTNHAPGRRYCNRRPSSFADLRSPSPALYSYAAIVGPLNNTDIADHNTNGKFDWDYVRYLEKQAHVGLRERTEEGTNTIKGEKTNRVW